jgi:5-formyltetrahydrofolate cyclo-ligase
MSSKNDLRKKIAEIKKEYSFSEKKKKSEYVFHKVEQLESFQKANYILSYWSMADEISTHDFNKKWAKSKTILLPVVDTKSDKLILKIFEGVDKMQAVKPFNILEPTTDEFLDYDKIDFIIVPGVAFDKSNNRMGRGKAFYDRLLPKLKAPKIGVCFDFQLLSKVPTDPHDVALDTVICD